MNIAIGIGTLLLGGWVLNTPEETVEPQTKTPPSAAAERGYPIPQNRQDAQRLREQAQTREQRQFNLNRKDTATKSGMTKDQPAVAPRTGTMMMPNSPTDILAGAGGFMPSSPTASQDEIEANAAAARDSQAAPPSGNPYAAYMPDMPTSRRAQAPRTSSSPGNYDLAAMQRQQMNKQTHPVATAPTQSAEKAFSSYRQSSGVSPYMQLFRNDTAGGTIDNYSTFVRPALDQRSMNQQFNMDLYGLERNSRLQQSALRQISQSSQRTLQSVGTPQYYMNYGNYYPYYGQGTTGSPYSY